MGHLWVRLDNSSLVLEKTHVWDISKKRRESFVPYFGNPRSTWISSRISIHCFNQMNSVKCEISTFWGIYMAPLPSNSTSRAALVTVALSAIVHVSSLHVKMLSLVFVWELSKYLFKWTAYHESSSIFTNICRVFVCSGFDLLVTTPPFWKKHERWTAKQ